MSHVSDAPVVALPPTEAPSSGSALDDPRVVRAVREYLALIEAGQRPSRSEIAARYPDVADVLADCLAGLELVHAAAPELSRPVAGTALPAGPELPEGGVLGDFRLRREIGRGGMGVVYEAEQVSLQRRVALKVLPFAAALDPRQLQRFKNEAQAAAALHHSNIVPVYAVGCERGVHFYAMQLIDGQTLADVIAQLRHVTGKEAAGPAVPTTPYGGADSAAAPAAATPPPGGRGTEPLAHRADFFRTAARLGQQAAAALEYAHQMGVVHRDVKPGNLMVDGRGQLWVTDFGLAQVQSDTRLTLTGDVVGTLRYMSPEQALGGRHAVDQRTDVYSLGATLYELLTLQPAFAGADRRELLRQIALEEPRPPRRLTRAVPAELETVVLKAMAKEPGGRYASAGELADDLGRWLRDEPIRARRPTAGQRLAKLLRRHRAVATTAALSFVLLLLLGLIGLAAANARIRTEASAKEQVLNDKLKVEKQRADEEQLKAIALRGWRRTAYYRQIALALHEYRANNVARADEMLEKCQPDLRGWEWHYLKRLCHSSLDGFQARYPELILPRHAWCFSPDARRLAIADGSQVRIYDTTTGREALVFTLDLFISIEMIFSPDSSQLAISGRHEQQNCVTLWQTATGKKLATFKGAKEVVGRGGFSSGDVFGGAAFGPDGRLLAAADRKGRLFVWDIKTGAEHFHITAHPLPNAQFNETWNTKPVFSPDGAFVVTACEDDSAVRFWDSRTGNLVHSLGQGVGFSRLAFSSKGTWVGATGAFEATRNPDPSVRVWDVKTRQTRHVFHGTGKPLTCLAFSPDERLFAVGSADTTLTLWDLSTGQEVACYRGHEYPIRAVVFRPDGRQVLSLDEHRSVRVWDATRAPEHLVLSCRGAWQVAVSGDGRRIAAAASHATKQLWGSLVWDARTGQELAYFADNSESPRAVALSPDGSSVAAATAVGCTSGMVRIWDLGTGQKVQARTTAHFLGQLVGAYSVQPAGGPLGAWPSRLGTLAGMQWQWFGLVRSLPTDGSAAPCDAVAWSPDGRLIASGGQDRVVRLWDAATGQELRVLGRHDRTVSSVAFSRDGKRLASASGGIQRTFPLTARNLRTWPSDGPKDIPDVKVWDVRTGELLLSLRLPGKGPGLAISPDGETIAATFGETGMRIYSTLVLGGGERSMIQVLAAPKGDVVRLYRVATGEEVAVLKGHTWPPWAVALSPDGQRVVTAGGKDETIKLWDASTGEEIMTVGRHPGVVVTCVTFSPDGQKILSTNDWGDVRIWDATPLKP